MLKHVVTLAALVLVCTAQDCATFTQIVVSPGAGVPVDSAAQAALAVAARLATRRGLQPLERGDLAKEPWTRCSAAYRLGYRGETAALSLCEQVSNGEVQFGLAEHTIRFTPRADSLRRELLDSLRAQFGATHVRECRPHGWRGRWRCRASAESPPAV